jgi:AcrR family transcriptional regulator
MRLRDENKRRLIVQTAGKLFSEQPFHKVRLEDVADAAGVGKGTVYIYFKNKEDLYYNLVLNDFAEMVRRTEERLATMTTSNGTERLRAVIDVMVDHSFAHPQIFTVLRTLPPPDSSTSWDATRKDMAQLIASVIQQGVASGDLIDPRPDLTGLYLMGMIRAVMIFVPNQVDAPTLKDHLWGLLSRGIVKPNGP